MQKPRTVDSTSRRNNTETTRLQAKSQTSSQPGSSEMAPMTPGRNANTSANGSHEFTLLNFNILADCLVDHTHYPGTGDEALAWKERAPRILKHITQEVRPDVLCLQEVDAEHFASTFDEKLASYGYMGHFKKRTRDKIDGCAVWFRKSAFRLLEEVPVEFFVAEDHILDRDNVALALVLEHCAPGAQQERLIVCTTHLLFNPRRGEVKLAQLMMLFETVRDIRGRYPDARLCLCGDFNSTPKSAIYEFLTTGELNHLRAHNPTHMSAQGLIIAACKREQSIHYNMYGPHGPAGTFIGRYQPPKNIPQDADEHSQPGSEEENACVDDEQVDNDINNIEYGSGDEGEDDGFTNPDIKRILEQFAESEGISKSVVMTKRRKRSKSFGNLPDKVETGVEPLKSAYAFKPTRSSTGEPAFTTYHETFKGTVDYVFYGNGLSAEEVLELPHAKAYGRGIPSTEWGSDHMSLGVRFQFKPL